jgi:hypothetical protein
MANNTYAPSGFHEARLFTGSSPNYAVNARSVAWNYASSIALGDPVFLNTSGNAALYVVAGTTIDGIATGFNYFDPNNILSGAYHPAWFAPTLTSSVVVTCKVITDPNMVFLCQANGTALTATSIGLNIDIYTGSSGVPTTGSGISTCALDAGNVHATATLPFRIVGIVGVTPGWETPAINSSYVGTNGNQWLAVTMNTQDMTTRTGQA